MKNISLSITTTLSTLALAAALVSGCASSTTTTAEQEDKAKCLAPKPGTITTANSDCVIMADEPVDPAVPAAEWKGRKVGFCCASCVPKWEKMTPAQKDAALAAVTKAK